MAHFVSYCVSKGSASVSSPVPPTLILSVVTPPGADRKNTRAIAARAFALNIKVGGEGVHIISSVVMAPR